MIIHFKLTLMKKIIINVKNNNNEARNMQQTQRHEHDGRFCFTQPTEDVRLRRQKHNAKAHEACSPSGRFYCSTRTGSYAWKSLSIEAQIR